MKRLAPVAIVFMLAALVGAMPSAGARSTAGTEANTYRYYTACSPRPDAVPAHRCPTRGTKGAFFKSLDDHVMYKVCVKFPNDDRLCATRQDAPRRALKINSITSHMVGRHTVTWFVAGNKVGTRHFTIRRSPTRAHSGF